MIGRTTRRMLLGALGGMGAMMAGSRKPHAEGTAANSPTDFGSAAEVQSSQVTPNRRHLRTAGYHAAGDGGGGLYRRVERDPGHGLTITSNDGAIWELVPENGEVNVLQAGARGDGITDDLPAIERAINAFTGFNGNESHGLTVLLPPTEAFYRCGSTLDLKRMVRLRGSSFVSRNAQLVFDPDVTGIIINLDTTSADTTTPATTQSRWSIIENLTIQSAGGTDPDAHGIRLRAGAYLREVVVDSFPGDGISVVASVKGSGYGAGNANRFKLEDCKSRWNGWNGLFIDGTDVNAGTIVNFDAEANGRYGIYDSSFLGNFYFGIHLASNGNPGRGYNSDAQTSRASHRGKRYHAVWSATETALARTEPGTDESVWRSLGKGKPGRAYREWTGSEPVGTFFPGGAAAFTEPTARNWITGYAEQNQAPAYLAQRSAWFGGINAAKAYGEGTWFSGEGFALGDVSFSQQLPDDHVEITFAIRRGADTYWRALAEGDDTQGLLFKWNDGAGAYEFRHANLDDRVGLQFASGKTRLDAGTGEPVEAGLPLMPKGVVLGDATSGRKLDYAVAPPGSGLHARGEIVFNTEPVPGGAVGWVCITAGRPGIWRSFGTIDR